MLAEPTPILQTQDLSLSLPDRAHKPLFGAPPLLHILKNINLRLMPGHSLGIVGESGSGKTSLGRSLVRLYRPSGGRLFFDGNDLTQLDARAMLPFRARLQMIFQDPLSSLNPRRRIGRILVQPLANYGRLGGRADARRQAATLLERVGLPSHFANRFPHELSGGQRQRVGIARAIALSPAVVVADEIVSGLDVSNQAQILLLLNDLKQALGLSLVFISHDLSVVRVLCDQVLVMRQGEMVEQGDTAAVFAAPRHPYTRALLDAIPLPVVEPGWADRAPDTTPDPTLDETLSSPHIPLIMGDLPGSPRSF